MKLSIDERTSLVLEPSRNHVRWHLERVIDGRKTVVLRSPRIPKADFDLKTVVGRLRRTTIADYMPGARAKVEDLVGE